MTVTRTFVLRGDFIDRITQPLQNINNVLEEQLRIQRDLIRVNEQITRTQRAATQSTERSAQAMRSAADQWRNFREQMTQAEIAASGIEKISSGFIDGISNAFEKMVKAGEKAVGFVQKRFSEAMNDQISDIQAAGSVFGSLSSAGLIDEGEAGYKRAKGIYKQLDMAIGDAVKSSTAPTDTIIGFSRTLTDNILPELIKGDVAAGKTLEEATRPAAKQMAQMYEQMALMTPAGYSPQMVSKSVQKMLQGSSLSQLSMYDFFQMNPVLMNQLEKKGFEAATSVKERLDIFQEALSVSLSPEAIAEMRNSISGGLQALEDTFLNPTVGVFSFARGFDWNMSKAGPGNKNTGFGADIAFRNRLMSQTLSAMQTKGASQLKLNGQTIDDYVSGLDTPLKIIGSTLGPFLQELANLFGTAGPVMGHVALLFIEYIGPILRKLAFNARVMQQDVASGKVSLSYAIGRMLAEVVKGVTELFKPGGAAEEVGNQLNSLIDQFMEGFHSLGHRVDWQNVIQQIMDTLSNTVLLPGLRDVLLAIFVALAAPSVIGGIFSAITMALMVPISTFMTTVAGPTIATTLGSIVTAITGALAAVFSPIGLLVGILAAMVALVVTALIRYRDQFGQIITNSFEAIILKIRNELFLKIKARFEFMFKKIMDLVVGIVHLIRKLPGQGDFGEGIIEFQEKVAKNLDDTREKIKVNEQKQVEAAMKVGDGFKQLGSAIKEDFTNMANTVKNQIGSLASTIGNGLNTIKGVLSKGINFIDNLGGSVQSTTKQTELVAKAGETAGKAAQAGTEAIRSGTTNVIQAIGKVESAAKSISAGGVGGPLGTAKGLKGTLGGAPISRRSASHGYNAIDFGVGQGTKLSVGMPANITTAAFGQGGYGGLIAGTFADGQTFKVAHMSAIGVKAGQQVGPGQVIGLTGGAPGTKGAGRSTGPHVHLEPDSIAIANRFKLGYDGYINQQYKHLMGAIQMESKMMPNKANVMIANDSETILTKQESVAMDNLLSDYNGRRSNNSQKNFHVSIKTLDPSSINEEVARRIGRAIASGFSSEVSSTIQTSSLHSY